MNKKLGALFDRFSNRGVHSGLNQTQNSFKMAGYIVAPLIISYFIIRVALPPQFSDNATLIAFVMWIVGVILYFFNAVAKARKFIVFPQAHVRFPDGQQVSYDILVPPAPNSYELLTKYKGGSHLYRVPLKDKLAYQEMDRPYPDIFNKMLLKTPASWNDSFNFNANGEFFFEGVFVEHPTCENVDITVVDWDEQGSSRLPIAVVTACSWYAKKVIASGGRKLPNQKANALNQAEQLNAVIKDLKAKNIELVTRNRFLEDEAEQYTKKEPRDIKELSDKRLERIRGEIGDIMDTERSWKDWIMVNGKWIAIALFIVGAAYFGAKGFGWI